MSKYHNKRIKTEYGWFDSIKEYRRWQVLLIAEKAGVIKDLKRQVCYELIPKQSGERAVTYIADFVYTDVPTGTVVVEDVKSEATKKDKAYIIKRKLLLWVHGIKLREI